jgi:2-octaprenyl-6-methoxyphenol hydroxylase
MTEATQGNSSTQMSDSKKPKSKNDYDVLIVGGGMVGASMAYALAPLALKVAVVEAYVFDPSASLPAYDDRSIALAYGSRLIYEGMGIWDQLASHVAPIRHIHVSDRGHLGATRLHAEQEKVPDLGYVVESRELGKVLYEQLQASSVDWIAPAKVTRFEQNDQGVDVVLDKQGKEEQITASVVIAADGTQSFIRSLCGIGVQQADYHQTAIIANVSTDKPAEAWAYERFTEQGPIALLPMMQAGKDYRWSLVWTHPPEQVEAVQTMSDEEFLNALQQAFGFRAGRFIKAGNRSAYPLSLIRANNDVQGRVVIIGNASHTLHPVAGQGLNLALRDVAVLADLLADVNQSYQQDCGHALLLDNYQQQRHPDYQRVMRYTDTLVKAFSNDWSILGHLRAGGLMTVDRIKPLKRLLAEQSMGLKFRQSRLSRGLSLQVSVAGQSFESEAINV